MTTRHYLLLCLLALASAASCTKDVLEGETSSPDEESAVMPDGLYTSEIDVKFTEDMAAAAEADFAAGKVYTKSDQFNEMVDRLGIVSVTRIFGEDERFAEREHRAGLHLWYRVKLERPSGIDINVSRVWEEFGTGDSPLRNTMTFGLGYSF